jgi:1,4-alpha-glucan branching enzyme
MRILIVAHRFPPATGGAEKVAYELAKNFTFFGHSVTVVTSSSITNNDTRGFSTGRPFTLESQLHAKHVELMNGFKIYRFDPTFQFWPFAINPSMKKWLQKNANKFDIIHVHGYQTYEAVIVSRLGVPYVLTAHDIVAHYGGILGAIKGVFDILFGKTILKNAQRLIALTPENKKQYTAITRCEDKVLIIPNGIDEPQDISFSKKEALRKTFGNPKHILVFVARIVKYKGAQHIISAMPEILKNYPDTKAIIVGEDQGYREELEKLASELGVRDNVVFPGRVSDVAAYYAIADAFILPSTGEGFGLSAVEAMSYGTPAILADMGGLKYVLQDVGGYALDMGSHNDKKETNIATQIAKHVNTIFAGGSAVEKRISRGEQNSKNYRWKDITKKTLDEFFTISRE